MGRWCWQGLVEEPEVWGWGVAERVLRNAKEVVVGVLERKATGNGLRTA